MELQVQGKTHSVGLLPTDKCCPGITPPTITETNLHNQTEQVELASLVTLSCEAEGEPPPEISWYKDGSLLPSETETLTIRQHFHLTSFLLSSCHNSACFSSNSNCCYESRDDSYFFLNDTGVYSCVRHNIAGSVGRFIELQYLPLPGEPHFILSPDKITTSRRQSRQLESRSHLLLIPPVWSPRHDCLHSLLFQEAQSKKYFQ